jgi:Undecaprenyl-phosphate glucose phosphotransferase
MNTAALHASRVDAEIGPPAAHPLAPGPAPAAMGDGASRGRARRAVPPALLAAVVPLADALCLLVAAALVWRAGFDSGAPGRQVHLAVLIGSLVALFALARRGTAPRRLRLAGAQAWLVATAVLGGVAAMAGCMGYLEPDTLLEQYWILAWLLGAAGLLAAWRAALGLALHALAGAGMLSRRVAVAGAPDLAAGVTARIMAAGTDWRVVGVFDDTLPAAELVDRCRQARIDAVVIALPPRQHERIAALRRKLSVMVADVYLLADIGDVAPAGVIEIADRPAIVIQRRPLTDWDALTKRVFDLALTVILLVLLSPLMVVISLAIKLTSSGPVLFHQPRIGFDNRTMRMMKFRSMYHHHADLLADRQTTRHDPRVTPVGRWLRRLSLDELPQLFNVLDGSMSLVGPRPHAPNTKADGKLFPDVVADYARRHRVKPGITGWAQVNGWRGETRTVTQIEERVRCDLYYIDNWSLALDAKILWRTALGGFYGPAAY